MLTAPTEKGLILPLTHPTYARMLCVTLRGLGVDVDAALHMAGLPPWAVVATSDALMDQSTIQRLIAAALRLSGRPWLGLEVGAAVQVSAHGPLGNAAVASRDLMQALETVARFGGVRYGAVRYQLLHQPSAVVMVLTELVDLGEARVFVTCMLFATLIRMMEAVTGYRLDHLVEVEFPFPEPPWRSEIERLCAGSLHFNKPHLAFHLSHTALQSPCMTADAKAFAAAYQQCEQLAFQSTQRPFQQSVFELLTAHEGHYPSLGEIAQHFSISNRTLMRRLKQDGSSYQALLDEAREQRARWYLGYSQLTIEEIAARLGFEDTSNFSRTFKRWTGTLPSQVRRTRL